MCRLRKYFSSPELAEEIEYVDAFDIPDAITIYYIGVQPRF